MAQQYDKVIKENLEKIVLQLIRKTTDIEPVTGELLYPELQYTLEREADFIEKIVTQDGQTIILHIEFQATNEKPMAGRMFVYAGLIYQIYRLPIRQVVFYIGKEPVNMPDRLKMPFFEYRYELIDLQQISYKQFIRSELPEEVLLAILCNFEEAKPETIIDEIFVKLRALQSSDLSFQRNIRQLSILSLLRDLQPLIFERTQSMALTLKMENDLWYQQGERIGEERGEKKGEKKGQLKGEKRKALEIAAQLIKKGLSDELITETTGLSKAEIEKIRAAPARKRGGK